ncbi:MAG: pilus assembly protein TadG-related protein [Acidimicrobiia bacterium]|nr:pilus assembly protein TadG-related protein [Acidimicrobiia bacterium]
MTDEERGSIVPIVAVMLAVAVVMMLVVSTLGAQAARRARAQAAADAAALAGVFEGERGAEELAGRNGAVLVVFESIGDDVRVVVTVDGVRAEAWARLDWVSIPASGP